METERVKIESEIATAYVFRNSWSWQSQLCRALSTCELNGVMTDQQRRLSSEHCQRLG